MEIENREAILAVLRDHVAALEELARLKAENESLVAKVAAQSSLITSQGIRLMDSERDPAGLY